MHSRQSCYLPPPTNFSTILRKSQTPVAKQMYKRHHHHHLWQLMIAVTFICDSTYLGAAVSKFCHPVLEIPERQHTWLVANQQLQRKNRETSRFINKKLQEFDVQNYSQTIYRNSNCPHSIISDKYHFNKYLLSTGKLPHRGNVWYLFEVRDWAKTAWSHGKQTQNRTNSKDYPYSYSWVNLSLLWFTALFPMVQSNTSDKQLTVLVIMWNCARMEWKQFALNNRLGIFNETEQMKITDRSLLIQTKKTKFN